MSKKTTQPDAFTPADFDIADVAAIKALERGTATEDQQKRALDWIINRAALTYDLDYRTESRDHAFSSGRRFVGLQIVKMLKLDLGKLKQQERASK